MKSRMEKWTRAELPLEKEWKVRFMQKRDLKEPVDSDSLAQSGMLLLEL